MSDKTPVHSICKSCGHTWTIAYLPLTVKEFCAIVGKNPRCPMCASKEVFVKTTDKGVAE